MIYLSKEVIDNIDNLFYYPYTIGFHLQKSILDLRNIFNALQTLPTTKPNVITRKQIQGVGVVTYMYTHNGFLIKFIEWNSSLKKFYYTKSNFITFNSKGNIASTHPSFYKERKDAFFLCDNGYVVVCRSHNGQVVYNFKDVNGNIISDIDFIQVKPFREENNMVARGFTPNRKCYVIYEDGKRIEVNESKTYDDTLLLNESHLRHIVRETLRQYLHL